MKLVVTIDTEEDNWGFYSATENPVKNIEEIKYLQKIFDSYGVKPTYLVSYPVATNQNSVAILKNIMENDRCEIGAHCHPWNTPPFDKNLPITGHDTMLCNLEDDLQEAKLVFLHEAIKKNFGITPVSFRAGRFGFGPVAARILVRLGYRVDSSVTPFMNWKVYEGPDYSQFDPGFFRFTDAGLYHKDEKGDLLEVPVTIGYLQPNFALCQKLMGILEKPIPQIFRLAGILYYLKLLNKAWLSPEQSESNTMIKLARRMEKNGYQVLNLTFHSTTLLPGKSPFVGNNAQKKEFFSRLENFLFFARNAGYHPQTLAQV